MGRILQTCKSSLCYSFFSYYPVLSVGDAADKLMWVGNAIRRHEQQSIL